MINIKYLVDILFKLFNRYFFSKLHVRVHVFHYLKYLNIQKKLDTLFLRVKGLHCCSTAKVELCVHVHSKNKNSKICHNYFCIIKNLLYIYKIYRYLWSFKYASYLYMLIIILSPYTQALNNVKVPQMFKLQRGRDHLPNYNLLRPISSCLDLH